MDKKEYMRQWREKNRERITAYGKAWREQNKDHVKNYNQQYHQANYEDVAEQKRAYAREYRVANLAKVKVSKATEYLNNRDSYILRARARKRQLLRNATPKWLSPAQKADIKNWYNLAKELQWLSEEPLHVDHIVPLQGENVSGLHVPWNLQILPRSENLRKGNKA